MSEEECPHGMGEVAWCTLCNGRERREAKQLALTAELRRRRAKYMAMKRRLERRAQDQADEREAEAWASGNAVPGLQLGGFIDEWGKGCTKLRRG